MSRGDLRRTWRVGDRSTEVEVHLEDEVLHGVLREGEAERPVEARVHRTAPDALIVRFEGRLHRAVLARQGSTLWIALDGQTYGLQVQAGGADRAQVAETRFTTSPMTGVLIQVPVEAGRHVEEGDVLFVVEAMKMEYAVRAPRPLRVAAVHARAGDKVKLGETVVSLAEDA